MKTDANLGSFRVFCKQLSFFVYLCINKPLTACGAIIMLTKIKQHIVNPLRRIIRYHVTINVPARKRTYAKIVRRVARKGKCRVLFIASSLPMWRYHEVIKLLQADPRFEIRIVIIPFLAFTPEEQKRDVRLLADYFASNGIDAETVADFGQLKRDFRPDMVVYPQPYDHSYDDVRADWKANRDCLLVHTPYSVPLTELEWYVNIEFHNAAWRFYVASDIHQNVSRRIADNKGENTVVVGEPHADQLLTPPLSNPWKKNADGKPRKRLIWAPHFSVKSYNMFDRPDFNWSHSVMREIAEQNADRLQIAFKPHPRLKSELYKHPDWGKERTDEFYSFWENSPTTQLETGDYIDLFKTSDAMVHNCGSFTAEYLFLQKPVAYITRDLSRIKAELNAFGAACQDAHYTLSSPEEIRRFVNDVVLDNKDPMAMKRAEVFETVMRTPNGTTVAQNIYNDLVHALFKS